MNHNFTIGENQSGICFFDSFNCGETTRSILRQNSWQKCVLQLLVISPRFFVTHWKKIGTNSTLSLTDMCSIRFIFRKISHLKSTNHFPTASILHPLKNTWCLRLLFMSVQIFIIQNHIDEPYRFLSAWLVKLSYRNCYIHFYVFRKSELST